MSTEREDVLRELRGLGDSLHNPEGRVRQSQLLTAYEATVPMVPLSRCPYSNEVLTHSIDTASLDGLWWQYHLPIRPFEDGRPPTFFALTGAVAQQGLVAPTTFSRLLGPEVPYVVPRMLLHPDVTAVVSSLQVGSEATGVPVTAYVIAYFAKPSPDLLARWNDWGSHHHTYSSADGAELWDEQDEDDAEIDVDLRRWVESGDLQWIEPGDSALRLRSGVSDCPYLDLSGRGTFEVLPGEQPVRRAPRKAAKPASAPKPSPRRRAT